MEAESHPFCMPEDEYRAAYQAEWEWLHERADQLRAEHGQDWPSHLPDSEWRRAQTALDYYDDPLERFPDDLLMWMEEGLEMSDAMARHQRSLVREGQRRQPPSRGSYGPREPRWKQLVADF